MKKTVLIFLLLVLMPSFLALASDYEQKGKAGNYTVEVRLDRNPPSEGSNNMSIYIEDRAQQPVTDARVKVHYFMPSLSGKAPMMQYDTTATPRGTHYLAQMNLSMEGEWTVILTVSRARKIATMKLSFFVK